MLGVGMFGQDMAICSSRKVPVAVYPLRVRSGAAINYCYILQDEVTKRAVIVDPAWDSAAIELALANLGAELGAVVLTHSHDDHVNAAPQLAMRHKCPVYMSAGEIAVSHFRCPGLRPVWDGHEIVVDSVSLTVLLTPGHTSGSVCYLQEHALFSGDTLFIEGCGIIADPCGDVDDMYRSIQKLHRMVPGDIRVWPGHRYRSELGLSMAEVVEKNIYFSLRDINQFRRFRMRAGQVGLFNFK
ncbi:MAG: MBL fold metallo-hydrolase [Cutibacterium avidum]|nr:MBL fold metallo-hydrolase [Cutibacterium avidum]